MDMITVKAKTLDEAITKALIQLGTTSDNLDYTVVEKGSSGLFGFIGAKDVEIRAKKKMEDDELYEFLDKKQEQPKAAQNKPAVEVEEKQVEKKLKSVEKKETALVREVKEVRELKESKPEETVKKSVDGTAYEESAKKFLIQIFDSMNMKVEIQASYHESDRELCVDMVGDDMGILIGKRGQTLDSLQYLVSLVVNKDCEGYVRVKLDTENYRSRRKETLETLARNIAYKVKRTRRPVSLEPMNPYERRIIHAALQNDKYVVTRSEGEDPFRHVVISLKRENRTYNNNQQ